jgi:hypothetical protein
LEQYHQIIKPEMKQVPHELPGDLEVAIAGFADYSAITKPLARDAR